MHESQTSVKDIISAVRESNESYNLYDTNERNYECDLYNIFYTIFL